MISVIEANKDCYDPLMGSIGHFCHGKALMKEMKNSKLMMARQFAQQSGELVEICMTKWQRCPMKLHKTMLKVGTVQQVAELFNELNRIAETS
ncbi:hypothetical protein POTOM_052439 [Populus tomentosa]|uniref:Uncharacterized protein n=1 Tax=Populus tomentosa TaxID=118781 RepID=A0A8X7XZM9_POPTO|nr:hypothetical protein POTOM_052439 [Populus tomentosa]